MSTTTLLQLYGALDSLEALSGATLAAVLLVLSVVLFAGPYRLARRHDLGTAHAVGAGLGGLGFVFLFLVALQLLHSPI
ncbi:hypothetical protein KM295_15470 [Natronomonas sp. F2-12]|jgi:hypothetical protein|uniref:Uncharacterized protein n=1 Tax=Natronomonas aquatica TaxID=2841590 RepID=A0A9R1CWG1_9EURY|nr:hypothetical protein [Natronomonas aquatica]MCQ4334854.1 hypothetical protein [Natronomonas aquatica]